jgi:hypothetical protein
VIGRSDGLIGLELEQLLLLLLEKWDEKSEPVGVNIKKHVLMQKKSCRGQRRRGRTLVFGRRRLFSLGGVAVKRRYSKMPCTKEIQSCGKTSCGE